MLREGDFVSAVVEMVVRAETRLPRDVVAVLREKARIETSRPAKIQYDLMLKNLKIAEKRGRPICQDTGTLTFFVRIGRGLRLGFNVQKALTRAVAQATARVPLRANLVDALTREPMRNNTGPGHPVVHLELVDGSGMQLDLLVRGSGAENCGRLFMLSPTEGDRGIERAVVGAIREAGGKPCPPTIVGVGIGGSSEASCAMAKRALLRPLSARNPDSSLERLEMRIERSANRLGIGCMGLGGRTTVLGVRVEKAACHTASLPVAVAFQCWAARKARARLMDEQLKVVEP
ncbi:MAG: fumarate hydratase [Candidatus Hadarchaeales archaeon]